MNSARRSFILFLAILVVPVVAWFLFFDEGRLFTLLSSDRQSYVIHVGNLPVKIELADTQAKRIQGLSKKASLDPNSGLLFIFESEGFHGIWMKDMNFPIDVLWLSKDGTIVDIRRDVSPNTFPEVFRPESPALYVLEVNANLTEIYGIGIGESVRLGSVVEN